MNKVSVRCQKQASAKFYYASKRMFAELKILKVLLYILAIVPVVLQFIPAVNSNEVMSFAYTVISFALTILNEVLSAFFNNHKESAILEHQLYESEITGSTFSKIEYDRESTNSLNELAIRKGLPKMHSLEESGKKYHISKVPDDISDDYSYLYLCRLSAAKTNYLLSRIFVFYAILLGIVICIFTACIFWKQNTADYLKLIIGFYPLVNPFIKNCASCKKTQKNCVKICADIDNFFADGDASIERLARFYYYTQNIEFEMMVNKPAIYNIFPAMFKRGLAILEDGVTIRFMGAINELYGKSKGLVGQARGKALITRVDYDLVKLEEKRKRKLQTQKNDEPKVSTDVQENKVDIKVSKPQTPIKKTVSNQATKKATKTVTSVSKASSKNSDEKKDLPKATTKKTTTKKATAKSTSTKNIEEK